MHAVQILNFTQWNKLSTISVKFLCLQCLSLQHCKIKTQFLILTNIIIRLPFVKFTIKCTYWNPRLCSYNFIMYTIGYIQFKNNSSLHPSHSTSLAFYKLVWCNCINKLCSYPSTAELAFAGNIKLGLHYSHKSAKLYTSFPLLSVCIGFT